MNNEMICKNCKYHYIEEISFDYPQSCCDKRKAVIEEWFKCDAFEYDDRYIEQLQQENQQLKIQISAREEVCKRLESNWNKLQEWIKVRDNIGLEKIRLEDIVYEMVELKKGSDKKC